jgi:hypothetical protein
MGLLVGTHSELEWNMLGTNGKIENNPSLLGVKFDATHLYSLYYMFSIQSNHIIINEVQYSTIMGHIQSSNSFFNCKTLHMIIVN